MTSDDSVSYYGYRITELKELGISGEVLSVKSSAISLKDAAVTGIKNAVYSGGAIRQSSLAVSLAGKYLTEGVDYTVSYRNNVNVGMASVIITGKDDYTGTKTAYFTILPKPTKLRSVKGAKKKFTVKWNKQAAQITGYQIQYGTRSSFKGAKVKTAGAGKTNLTIKKLKAKKTYYVRIRTYRKVGAQTYYSAWSAKKKVKTR